MAGWQELLSALSLICHLPRLLGRGTGGWIQMPIVCPSAGSRASTEREVLAASDAGADARGSTLIRETLALRFHRSIKG